MPKKPSYKSSSVSTGRVEKSVPSNLDQLFGIDRGGKFGTLDFATYEKTLDSMTLGELQEEARKINCPPIDDKERLKRSLKNEFRIYASTFVMPKQPSQVDPSKVPQHIKDIMREGK